jgi:hypothetical protein
LVEFENGLSTHKADSVVDIIGYEKKSMEGSQKNEKGSSAVPLGATLNERLSARKCSLPSLAIVYLINIISIICKIFKKFCHYGQKK